MCYIWLQLQPLHSRSVGWMRLERSLLLSLLLFQMFAWCYTPWNCILSDCVKVHWKTGNASFFFGFCVVKRVIFTIESIIDDINVCFGDTPQTVILCPKIHPSPWATFSKHPFSSDSLGHHPWGFLLNPEVRFTENWLKTDPRIH